MLDCWIHRLPALPVHVTDTTNPQTLLNFRRALIRSGTTTLQQICCSTATLIGPEQSLNYARRLAAVAGLYGDTDV